VQELQRKYGKEKFEIVLLSVDADYGTLLGDAKKDVIQTTRQHGVSNWPAVVEPKGWAGVRKSWGVDGYELILVDQAGRVVRSDLIAEQLDGLLAKLIKA
jgi:hypothetical protein